MVFDCPSLPFPRVMDIVPVMLDPEASCTTVTSHDIQLTLAQSTALSAWNRIWGSVEPKSVRAPVEVAEVYKYGQF